MNHLKKNTFIIFLVFLGLLIFLSARTNAQISIFPGPGVTSSEMADTLAGDGIIIDDIVFSGANGSRGIFNNAQTTNLGMESGIFITSGAGYVIPGPNKSSSAGANNGTPGGWPPFPEFLYCSDLAYLIFDVVPLEDTILISFIFGSEEYNEWVGNPITDVFRIYISGPEPTGGNYGNYNLATVPGTTLTVSINTINNGYAPPEIVPTGPGFNSEYFIDNTNGLTLEYDAFTTVLTGGCAVIPAAEYHIVIAIADKADGIYDSGVFLEENSLISPGHADLLRFGFKAANNPSLTHDFYNLVETDKLIFVFPQGEYNDTLAASFETRSGTSVYVNGIIQESGISLNDFSDTLLYHLVGWEGSVKDYTVIVLNNENDIAYYAFESEFNPELEQDYVANIEGIQIIVNLPIISGVENLIASFDLSDEATAFINWIPQQSGITPNDFTSVVNYIVEAETGNTKNYTVDVDYELNSANDFLSFGFDPVLNPGIEEYAAGIIGENTVDLYLPDGTEVSNLIATFTLPIQAEAYVFGQTQVSGVTSNDFTNPKIYNVEAGDGSLKDWLVTVHLITGIGNPAPGEILVYPNPASDRLIIRNAANFRLKIYSIFGKLISESKADNEIFTLNLQSIPDGIYYLQIENTSGREVRKIIVL